MLLARIDETGERIRATPEARAICPMCGEQVIAKCGEIKQWHWAHKARRDCDSWGEGETDWHLYWKSLVPQEWTEVTIEKDGIKHRADIQLPSGLVVELQHSSMPVSEIAEREMFYGKMIWLFDVIDAHRCGRLGLRSMKKTLTSWMNLPVSLCPDFDRLDETVKIGWSHPCKYVLSAKAPSYLDIGRHLVVRPQQWWYGGDGWGYIANRRVMVDWLISGGRNGDADRGR